MHVLIKGLPRDALVRTPESERGRDPWTAELELMAQLVELTSVLASNHRIKKPVKVPRPKNDKTAKAAAAGTTRRVAVADGNPYRSAIRAFGAAQPARIRESREATADPAPRQQQEQSGAFTAARRMFSGSQPSRLRVVHDEERTTT